MLPWAWLAWRRRARSTCAAAGPARRRISTSIFARSSTNHWHHWALPTSTYTAPSGASEPIARAMPRTYVFRAARQRSDHVDETRLGSESGSSMNATGCSGKPRTISASGSMNSRVYRSRPASPPDSSPALADAAQSRSGRLYTTKTVSTGRRVARCRRHACVSASRASWRLPMLSIQTAVGMCAAALSVAPSGVDGPPTLATEDATCAAYTGFTKNSTSAKGLAPSALGRVASMSTGARDRAHGTGHVRKAPRARLRSRVASGTRHRPSKPHRAVPSRLWPI